MSLHVKIKKNRKGEVSRVDISGYINPRGRKGDSFDLNLYDSIIPSRIIGECAGRWRFEPGSNTKEELANLDISLKQKHLVVTYE